MRARSRRRCGTKIIWNAGGTPLRFWVTRWRSVSALREALGFSGTDKDGGRGKQSKMTAHLQVHLRKYLLRVQGSSCPHALDQPDAADAARCGVSSANVIMIGRGTGLVWRCYNGRQVARRK